jgi:putative addiction module killer protein
VIKIVQTQAFSTWLHRLRDTEAKRRIATRLNRLSLGNPGDVAPVGEGVSEIRIHYGPGYRIYFTQAGDEIVLLLCGGDKKSQTADIRNAKESARAYKRSRQ